MKLDAAEQFTTTQRNVRDAFCMQYSCLLYIIIIYYDSDGLHTSRIHLIIQAVYLSKIALCSPSHTIRQ